MKKKLLECEICGKTHEAASALVFDGVYMCPQCFEEKTIVCRCCGERIWQRDAEDLNLCHECAEEHYNRCHMCDALIHCDDTYYTDDDYDRDDPYCGECFHKHEVNKAIHDYYYKPEPIFFGNGTRYYGVELEVDEGGEYSGNAQTILNVANHDDEHLYIKHDGSLDDGFEMVSHPMILDYHMNYMPWKQILRTACSLNYRSHQAGTCGLHVHISRTSLGSTYEEQENTIAKILYFYEKFWNEILKFSRRTAGQAERWARRYGGGLINPKETLKHAKNSYIGRYTAVNLENSNTVEMRIFRGTLKYNTFAAVLQFVDSICDIAVLLSDEEMQNLTWLDFVQRIPPEKKELINYLKLKRLYVNDPIEIEEEV